MNNTDIALKGLINFPQNVHTELKQELVMCHILVTREVVHLPSPTQNICVINMANVPSGTVSLNLLCGIAEDA